MRNGQLVRVLKVCQRLGDGRRHVLLSLADEFRVTTRTIRRDIDAIQEAGIAVHRSGQSDDDDSQRGFWWVQR